MEVLILLQQEKQILYGYHKGNHETLIYDNQTWNSETVCTVRRFREVAGKLTGGGGELLKLICSVALPGNQHTQRIFLNGSV